MKNLNKGGLDDIISSENKRRGNKPSNNVDTEVTLDELIENENMRRAPRNYPRSGKYDSWRESWRD